MHLVEFIRHLQQQHHELTCSNDLESNCLDELLLKYEDEHGPEIIKEQAIEHEAFLSQFGMNLSSSGNINIILS